MRSAGTIGAFAAIYLIWGSTYLGIRIAVDTIPPLLMTAVRALIAGAILLSVGWLRHRSLPDGPEGRRAMLVGGLMVGVGNGGVALAERTVASSVAAIVVATIPLWVTGIEAISGRRPHAVRVAGLAVALLGVIVLSAPAGSVDPAGLGVLLVAAGAWSIGTLHSRRPGRRASVSVVTGVQLLSGGLVLAVASVAMGELALLETASISHSSVLAVAYLIVFGSLIAFSAYTHLLGVVAPGRVATYAFVNPLVAVALGMTIGGEMITAEIAVAAGLILLGVLATVAAPAGIAPRVAVPLGQPAVAAGQGGRELRTADQGLAR